MSKICVKSPFWLKNSIGLGKVAQQMVPEYSFKFFSYLEYSFNRNIHFFERIEYSFRKIFIIWKKAISALAISTIECMSCQNSAASASFNHKSVSCPCTSESCVLVHLNAEFVYNKEMRHGEFCVKTKSIAMKKMNVNKNFFEIEQWNLIVKRFIFIKKKVITLSVFLSPLLQRSKPTGWNPMKCQSDTQSRKYTSSSSTFDAFDGPHIYLRHNVRVHLCDPPFMNPLSSGGLDDGTFLFAPQFGSTYSCWSCAVRSVTFQEWNFW